MENKTGSNENFLKNDIFRNEPILKNIGIDFNRINKDRPKDGTVDPDDRRISWPVPEENFYHPFVPCFFGATAGIVFDSYCPISCRIYSVLFGILILLTVFIVRSGGRSLKISKEKAVLTAVVLLSFVLFAGDYQLQNNCLRRDDISRYAREQGAPIVAEGWIARLPVSYDPVTPPLGVNIPLERSTSTVLVLKRILNQGVWSPCSGKAALRLTGNYDMLRIGDLVRIKGSFSLVLPPNNRYEYDRQSALLADGIRTNIYSEGDSFIELIREKDRYSVGRYFESVRRGARSLYQKYLSEKNAQLASAMMFGLRSDLDPEISEAFKKTGTVHVLAISGLHLAIVCGFVLLILKSIGLPDKIAIPVLMAATVFYLLAAGNQPPVFRAAVMILVYSFGRLLHRNGCGLNSLILTALIILLIKPNELFQFGTQISFLAVGVFLWLPGGNTEQQKSINIFRLILIWHQDKKIIRAAKKSGISLTKKFRPVKWNDFAKVLRNTKFIQAFWTSFIIWLVLLPAIVWNLSLVTPVAVLVNPFIVLPLSIILSLALLLVLTGSWIPFFPGIIADMTDVLFDLMRMLVDFAQKMPGGFFYIARFPLWWCIGFYLPLILLTLVPSLKKWKTTVWFFMICWIAVACLIPLTDKKIRKDSGLFEANIFSVGHGASFFLEFPDGRNVLLDCGCFTAPKKVGNTIACTLWNKNVRQIDLLILSHADSDHYNAVDTVIEHFPIQRVLVPPNMFKKNNEFVCRLKKILTDRMIEIVYADAETDLAQFGYPELTVLHPPRIDWSSIDGSHTNQYCLTLRLEFAGKTILFPGDLEDNNAPFLQKSPFKTDLLLAPHHGGKVERYQNLLNWTKPETVIISGGSFQNNSEEEMKLRRQGFKVYNTKNNGEIVIQIKMNSTEKVSELQVIPFKNFSGKTKEKIYVPSK